jgi:hypothetical protein
VQEEGQQEDRHIDESSEHESTEVDEQINIMNNNNYEEGQQVQQGITEYNNDDSQEDKSDQSVLSESSFFDNPNQQEQEQEADTVVETEKKSEQPLDEDESLLGDQPEEDQITTPTTEDESTSASSAETLEPPAVEELFSDTLTTTTPRIMTPTPAPEPEPTTPESILVGPQGCPEGQVFDTIEKVCVSGSTTPPSPQISGQANSAGGLQQGQFPPLTQDIQPTPTPTSTPTQPPSPLPPTGVTPTPTPTPDLAAALTQTLTPMLPPVISIEDLNPRLPPECAGKEKEFYLSPNDPCLDPVLALCDETLEDNPHICGFDPRENPHGYRCINEQGQWSANVRECFPQEEDRLRELCGPQWQPGEECLIYGPEKTVLYGATKVRIGNSPPGPGQRSVYCVEAPEGGCITDAPFAPGGGCGALAASARQACEDSKKSGFDEMRKQYLLDQINQAYSDWLNQEKQRQEAELQQLLDDFNRYLDEQGIENPCAGLNSQQCDEVLLGLDQCAQGNPACDAYHEWREAYEEYLRNHPDACAGMSREQCYDHLLGTDHCALGNPLCADYEPNLQRAHQGQITTPSTGHAPPYPFYDEDDEIYDEYPETHPSERRLYDKRISPDYLSPDDDDEDKSWLCRNFPGLCQHRSVKPDVEPFHKTLCRHSSGLFPAICVSP